MYPEIDLSAMPRSFFHVGLIVPDLEKAIARFSDVLDIRFTEPQAATIPFLADPDPRPGPVQQLAVMSRTEPPYYELIQADGDQGIFSSANAGGILYYGLWEKDIPGRLERLRASGVSVDAVAGYAKEMPPYAIWTGRDLFGARLEYVDEATRPVIEDWVRTGKLPEA
ncbi:VOC family protein [Nonomuraea lactucae]|uniref:VOC family protein n=1 Tax=Nonomuraea lactucae TaxID=2249762 RepID=UPI000DE1E279|nr:VOC family protein [Nonomuraea lactucae]